MRAPLRWPPNTQVSVSQQVKQDDEELPVRTAWMRDRAEPREQRTWLWSRSCSRRIGFAWSASRSAISVESFAIPMVASSSSGLRLRSPATEAGRSLRRSGGCSPPGVECEQALLPLYEPRMGTEAAYASVATSDRRLATDRAHVLASRASFGVAFAGTSEGRSSHGVFTPDRQAARVLGRWVSEPSPLEPGQHKLDNFRTAHASRLVHTGRAKPDHSSRRWSARHAHFVNPTMLADTGSRREVRLGDPRHARPGASAIKTFNHSTTSISGSKTYEVRRTKHSGETPHRRPSARAMRERPKEL